MKVVKSSRTITIKFDEIDMELIAAYLCNKVNWTELSPDTESVLEQLYQLCTH